MSNLETPKERQQRIKEREELLGSISLREDYRTTYSTESGRKVLEDAIIKGHMLETTCSGNAWSYFYEGERNHVLYLMSLIPELVGDVMRDILVKRQDEINKTLADLTIEDSGSNE